MVEIELGVSGLYRKTLLLLYGLCAFVTLQSALPFFVQLLLLGQGCFLLGSGRPMGKLTGLCYQGEAWWLTQGEVCTRYDALRLVSNLGLFLLLEVAKEQGERRYLILFCDQLTPGQWRSLMWYHFSQ